GSAWVLAEAQGDITTQMQNGSKYVPPHLRGGGGEEGPGPAAVQPAGIPGGPGGPVPVQGAPQ
ncbi:unnamed protein product, partial [Ectocarpus fasciculatus]